MSLLHQFPFFRIGIRRIIPFIDLPVILSPQPLRSLISRRRIKKKHPDNRYFRMIQLNLRTDGKGMSGFRLTGPNLDRLRSLPSRYHRRQISSRLRCSFEHLHDHSLVFRVWKASMACFMASLVRGKFFGVITMSIRPGKLKT